MIRIEPSIFEKTPEFCLGCLELEKIIIRESPEAFWMSFEREINGIRDRFKDFPLTDDPYIRGMRRLFKFWRIDPARYRPSAERLCRRILKGDALYRVNTAVDVCNLISLRFLLPLGLYDKHKIHGELTLRYGAEKEHYLGITGIEMSAWNKVVVCDNKGPVGSAVTDSRRTAIDETTHALILLVYGPENVDEPYIKDVMHGYTAELSALQDPPPVQAGISLITRV